MVRSGELAFSEEQVQSILQATTSQRDYHLLKLAVLTGMRRSDVVRVEWDNIDYEHNRVQYLEKKKSNNPHEAWLPESYSAELQRFEDSCDNNIYVIDGGVDQKYGQGHLSNRQAYNILEDACKKAGVEPRRFHALRSTCIKLCQKRGWSMEATARHVNDKIETIKHHYLTPSRQEMRKAAQEKPIIT